MNPALPLQQSPAFGAALGLLGRTVQEITIDGAAPVVAVRVCGNWLASRGPVWLDRPLPEALAASPLRLINAEAPDDAGMRRAGFRKLATAAFVADLDLTQRPEARLAAMHGKWRNIWRRGQTAPVTIRQDSFDPQTHAWLLHADRAQQRAKRFRALPHSLIRAYASTSDDAVHVLTARSESGAPLAAMLFLLHAPAVTYHLGWNSPLGRRLGLHHLLLVSAADRFAREGFTRLDLGTVDTENAPGLARFKIGCGAAVRPLGGTWLQLPF